MHLIVRFLLLGSLSWAAATGEHLVRRGTECGPGIGACPAGECCSEAQWCGTSPAHCGGSTCRIEYSDSCDTFFPPAGSTTEGIPRPLVGNVPYGQIITQCRDPGMIALTFDDGPYEYTSNILDILDLHQVKATFFIAGNNKAKRPIDDEGTAWPAVMKRMHAAGHHIASHTWTHRDLNQVNSTIQKSEVIFNEMAFRNLFGWVPTYFRPPYLECSQASECQTLLATLGYHIIHADIDTKDYLYDSEDSIQTAKNRFLERISSTGASEGHIVLAHDVHYQTVFNLTEFMIQESRDRGHQLVTVGECLGDPPSNWYRTVEVSTLSAKATATTTITPGRGCAAPSSSSTSARPQPSSSETVSTDQTCGGTQAFSCRGSAFGNCCSWYGYCGSSSEYCGTGCSPQYGECAPVPTGLSETTNGLCGTGFQASCKGYGEKQCCSEHGYCGNTSAHCGVGCQPLFGECH